MGRSSKSKRFVQKGKDFITKHDEKFPYHSTLAEAEEKKLENVEKSSYGGV
ncbi:hypothetical protein [Bacillus sp. AK128]